MLRIVLGVLLVAVVGGFAYLFTHAQGPAVSATSLPESPAPMETGNRARTEALPKTAEPAPEGPALSPSQDIATLPGPQPEVPRATPEAPIDPTIPGNPAPEVKSMPAAPVASKIAPPQDASVTFDRQLALPIAGLKPSDIHDTFNDARGGGSRRHEATDIMAPRGIECGWRR